jgi:hypothetical protein
MVLSKKPAPTANVVWTTSAKKDALYGGNGRPLAWNHAERSPRDRTSHPGGAFKG